MKYYRFHKGELQPLTEEQFKLLEKVETTIHGRCFCLAYEDKGMVRVILNGSDLMIKEV